MSPPFCLACYRSCDVRARVTSWSSRWDGARLRDDGPCPLPPVCLLPGRRGLAAVASLLDLHDRTARAPAMTVHVPSLLFACYRVGEAWRHRRSGWLAAAY